MKAIPKSIFIDKRKLTLAITIGQKEKFGSCKRHFCLVLFKGCNQVIVSSGLLYETICDGGFGRGDSKTTGEKKKKYLFSRFKRRERNPAATAERKKENI